MSFDGTFQDSRDDMCVYVCVCVSKKEVGKESQENSKSWCLNDSDVKMTEVENLRSVSPTDKRVPGPGRTGEHNSLVDSL